MIYQLAGTITLIGCLISMWHMTSHLRNFNKPAVQRKILAILWMCPIYSVTSWLSLVLPRSEGYLAILKDLYEAYVIYQFLSFLIAVLGNGDREAVVELLAKHEHLTPPVLCRCWHGLCSCCKKRRRRSMSGMECEDEKRQLADDILLQCQVCAMQFVFLRPLLTTALFVLKKLHYHGPMFGPGSPFDHSDNDDDILDGGSSGGGGMLDYRSPQFYIIILENVSVFLAFSGLLNFYHAVHEDLSWCRPFPKFLCIKGVVFMTFWQGLVISLLANTTEILSSGGEALSTGDGDDEGQVETWAKQAQNFLICIEMLGFSIAHFYCFPVEEWEEGYRPVEDTSKYGDSVALGDFMHDLKLILTHNKRKKRLAREKFGTTKPNGDDSTMSTISEGDEEIGRTASTDSSDDGLQSLLNDVEVLLENRNGKGDAVDTDVVVAIVQTESVSSAGSSQQSYQHGVQESLKAINAPIELRQATALLLQSSLLDENTARLLTSDILDQSIDNGGSENDDDGEGYIDEENQSPDDDLESLPSMDGIEEAVAAGAPTTAEDESQLSESTSLLLATPTENDDMLRPSIFTMHSKSFEELQKAEE